MPQARRYLIARVRGREKRFDGAGLSTSDFDAGILLIRLAKSQRSGDPKVSLFAFEFL